MKYEIELCDSLKGFITNAQAVCMAKTLEVKTIRVYVDEKFIVSAVCSHNKQKGYTPTEWLQALSLLVRKAKGSNENDWRKALTEMIDQEK